MVGGTSKETNWTAAIAAAEKHPEGELVNVHGQTLRAMEKSGGAYRRDGRWYMQGKGPGPMEEPKIVDQDKVTTPGVKTGEVQVEADAKLIIDLEPEEGERLEISLSQVIEPRQVWAHVSLESGEWVVGLVYVKGRLYRKDNTLGERWVERLYSGPLDEDFEGPVWLAPLLKREIAKRLGGGSAPVAEQHNPASEMVQRQVDPEEKERSRAALEVSPQRSQFDSALRVLLMRENLDGTEWAIRQLREGSDAARVVAEESTELRLDKDLMWMTLGLAADELEKLLDKRAAELATREH
jgi:hypothetical protein